MTDQVQTLLLDWWRQEGRVLPWRQKLKPEAKSEQLSADVLRDRAFDDYFATDTFRDPYRVVVAELMLQQTQVERVLSKYLAWMEKWPTIEIFAQTTLPEVLTEWQGLGYNRRARFLWLLGQEIVVHRAGKWPQTEKELLDLPGIGPYTARAILSFAFGQQVGVVDTNVQRILQRVFSFTKAPAQQFIFADQLLPMGQADPWNQALMDFGALICTARSPKCPNCPLKTVCEANLAAQQTGFANYAEFLAKQVPLKKKKTVAFKDTDRYFRGRILDELRGGEVQLKELENRLAEQYGLADQARFTKLVQKLRDEKMIDVDQEIAKLSLS